MITRTSGHNRKHALQGPWETFSGVLVCLKGGFTVLPLDLREAAFTEVLARVSFRLIVLEYRKYPLAFINPMRAMHSLAQHLDRHDFGVMAVWVRAYAAQQSDITPITFIREGMVFRARCGETWRGVVYPDYKGTRGADPRVTNRGVSSSRRQTRGL
jgi:hypothetical protein